MSRNEKSWVAVVPVVDWWRARQEMGLDAQFVDEVTRAFLKDVVKALHEARGVTDVVVVCDRAAEHDIAPGAAQVLGVTGAETNDDALRVVRQWLDVERPWHGLIAVAPNLPCVSSSDLEAMMAQAGDAGPVWHRDEFSERVAVLVAPDPNDAQLCFDAVPAPGIADHDAPPRRSQRRVRTGSHLAAAIADRPGPHTSEVWVHFAGTVSGRFGVMTGASARRRARRGTRSAQDAY